MEKNSLSIITETMQTLLEKLGFSASLSVFLSQEEENTFVCKIQVKEDQHFLIGQYGANLSALQHLVRVILHKQIDQPFQILIDVNDYFLEKKRLLEKEAEKAMKEVLENNISVSLRPMLPYERKIVHSFLAKYKTVCTESIGRLDERKVIVSPCSRDTEAKD